MLTERHREHALTVEAFGGGATDGGSSDNIGEAGAVSTGLVATLAPSLTFVATAAAGAGESPSRGEALA